MQLTTMIQMTYVYKRSWNFISSPQPCRLSLRLGEPVKALHCPLAWDISRARPEWLCSWAFFLWQGTSTWMIGHRHAPPLCGIVWRLYGVPDFYFLTFKYVMLSHFISSVRTSGVKKIFNCELASRFAPKSHYRLFIRSPGHDTLRCFWSMINQ